MGSFSDAQGQLTLQSVVASGRISNSSELSCMSSLPVSIKMIGCKVAKKRWQHRFFRRSRAGFSVVRGRIWPKFELIKALMYVIVSCKYEKDPIKNSWEKVATPFFPLKVYGDFSDAKGQLTPQSVVISRRILKYFELSCMSLLPASMKRVE